jgi:hypothetical protein
MAQLILLDIPPTPAGIGALLAVVLLVGGFIALLAIGLVLFLWYRKRGMCGVEMIRPDAPPAGSAQHAHPSNPNQP